MSFCSINSQNCHFRSITSEIWQKNLKSNVDISLTRFAEHSLCTEFFVVKMYHIASV